MNTKEKAAFRSGIEWKTFRAGIIIVRNSTCDSCGVIVVPKNTKRLHLHHMHKEDYTVLEPDRFALLCRDCHSYLHHLESRLRGRKGILSDTGLISWAKKYLH
jgi:hypothetical protein